MKVIDLLNKIAKGEKVPKWVVYDEKEYTYMEEYKDYVHTIYNNGTMLFLLSEIFNKNGIDIVLNQELDFIEEEKIPEKLNIKLSIDDENKVNCYRATNLECDLAFKINSIIDYLQSKKE